MKGVTFVTFCKKIYKSNLINNYEFNLIIKSLSG